MGQGPGSDTAAKFYGAVLDQRVFWEHTFAHGNKNGLFGPFVYKVIILPRQARDKHRENHSKKDRFVADGVMEFSLPAGNKTINGTDGQSLAKLVLHSVVRDMIIRADTWFPK
jgi:hypothetical protein